jgi:glycosyltransferase involved in cell wall biosynthesis
LSGPKPWVVFQEGARRRWGGDLRRAYIFADLIARTGATGIDGWDTATVERTLRARSGRWLGVFPRPRPLVASSELLSPASIRSMHGRATPVALDVHDDPVAQHRSLGASTSSERLVELTELMRTNLAAFPILVAPSPTFADLAGLDPDRRVIASNGTDTRHIVPSRFPDRPAIGFASGAAPGRGIEILIAAARLVRERFADLRLFLWLAATGAYATAYIDGLRAAVADDLWIEIGYAPYDRLSSVLGNATVLAVPHPADPYMDSALPIKLFDAMAAGRPVVVTPRTEMAALVRKEACGLVALGDRPEDLAGRIAELLEDPVRSATMGASGRAAAEKRYDWSVIGRAVADEILRRTAGPAGGPVTGRTVGASRS